MRAPPPHTTPPPPRGQERSALPLACYDDPTPEAAQWQTCRQTHPTHALLQARARPAPLTWKCRPSSAHTHAFESAAAARQARQVHPPPRPTHLEVQAQLCVHAHFKLQQLLVQRVALLGRAHHKHLHLRGGGQGGRGTSEACCWPDWRSGRRGRTCCSMCTCAVHITRVFTCGGGAQRAAQAARPCWHAGAARPHPGTAHAHARPLSGPTGSIPFLLTASPHTPC